MSQTREFVLAQIARELGARRYVEVGCKAGRVVGYLARELPELQITAVDPWRAMPENSGPGMETYEKWDFAKIERDFWAAVGEHAPRVTMLRMTSEEAAAMVPDGSVDLVFIDAAHDYHNAVADMRRWGPKVRPGGMLAGHDYQHKFPGVIRAVADCFMLLDVALLPDSVWAVKR